MEDCFDVKWKEAYELGNSKIDSEHKKLFDFVEKSYHVSDKEQLKSIFMDLIKHSKNLFVNEEKLLQSIKYPACSEHRKFHNDLLRKLALYLKDIDSKNIDDMKNFLKDFIVLYLTKHMLIEDKRFLHFSKNKQELLASFKWKNSYTVGAEIIDKQHKKLFNIAQKALSYRGSDKKAHVKSVILELYDYMKVHFKEEQALMEKIEYPLFQDHYGKHKMIIKQMNEFVSLLPTMDIDEYEAKLIDNIDKWLVNHIIVEDLKISSYILFKKNI